MGATNHTPVLGLPQFADGDKPTWRGDVNGAFADIETMGNALYHPGENNGDARWARSAAFGVSQVVNPTHALLQQALTDAVASGLRVVTSGTYTTDQTLTMLTEADLSMLTINYTGTGNAVLLGGANKQVFRQRFRLPKIINTNKTANGWGQVAATVGVRAVNLYSCTIDVSHIKHFEIGLQVSGATSNGSQQNTFNLGHLDNNKVNIDFAVLDATGWANQNTFVGGRCQHNSNEGAQVAGTRHVRFNALGNPVNGHTFIGTSLESPNVVEYHIEAASSSYNTFVGCRFENTVNANRRILCTGTSRYNQFVNGAYVENFTFVCQSGGQPFGITSGAVNRSINPTNVPNQWLENLSSAGALAFAITAPGVATDTTGTLSVAQNYTIAASSNAILGKRTNDTPGNERIVIDANGGKLKLGDGLAAPEFTMQTLDNTLTALSTTASGMAVGCLVDGDLDIGRKGQYRFGYVRAKNALVTGSGATASRPAPATAGIGAVFFDTTLNKPVWCTGAGWVDSTGAAV